MKRLAVFFAVVFLVVFVSATVRGEQEAQASADLQARAIDHFLDRAIGVMRVTPQSANSPTTCGFSRGSMTFGVPITSSFGDCFIEGTYIDFWSFSAQAGQPVRVTFSSSASILVAIQDYTSGDILADSKAACGGGLCKSANFSYTPSRTDVYLIGLGSLTPGTYTVTVDSVGTPPPGGANLAPYKPTGWSDKIVVSTVTDTHTDAAVISPSDTIYVDYCVANVGTGSTGAGFNNQLFLDGVLIRTGNANTLDVNYYTWGGDVVISPQTPGVHTLRLKADSGSVISETNETDNEYSRTFTVSGGSQPCVAGVATLCVNSSRFKVTVAFQTPTSSGNATAVALTGDTGYFWFFSSNNVELVVKVVDGRAVNNRFWVFAGGLTNVNVVITVTDTQTGAVKTYTNPQGAAFQPIQDTNAFPG